MRDFMDNAVNIYAIKMNLDSLTDTIRGYHSNLCHCYYLSTKNVLLLKQVKKKLWYNACPI